MTRKRRRLIVVLVGLTVLGVAVALILSALGDSLVFFYGPSDLSAQRIPSGRHVRIGGLVEEGSVQRADDGKTIRFKITDGSHDVAVTYSGVVPDLFREGQGVVAEGTLDGASGGARMLEASTVLAKHDERYMPKEVVEALKKSGQWRGDAPAPGAAEVKARNP